MKNIYILLTFFFSTCLLGQNQKGFTIISGSNTVVEDSDNFALTTGEQKDTQKQGGIFCFSFSDSIFVHTTRAYKKKKVDLKMRSQVYKITNILSLTNKDGIDLYLITVKSGLTGKQYDYYIEYQGEQIVLSQIYKMSGDKEKGYKYSGISYTQLNFALMQPYNKN